MSFSAVQQLGFNPAPPTVMHIDLNSCFATVEQQANPLLRGKPVAVAAYTSPGGCILAASREAKYGYGVKTGMRVREGRELCPALVVLPSDPDKYRFVNRKLLALLSEYSSDVTVKSIDEMVVNFSGSPALQKRTAQYRKDGGITTSDNSKYQILPNHSVRDPRYSNSDFIGNCIGTNIKSISSVQSPMSNVPAHREIHNSEYRRTIQSMEGIGQEIKQRIRQEIGEWLTVSVGIAPNRYLAKIGAGLHKPDGLDVIAAHTVEDVFTDMPVEELCGIKAGYGTRLRRFGLTTALSFYRAPIPTLRVAFSSIVGYYWWLRLHGWEADGQEFQKKSVGHSYALSKPYTPDDPRLLAILTQLTEKMGRRLRRYGMTAGGIHVSCVYREASDSGINGEPATGWEARRRYRYWHEGRKLPVGVYTNRDLFRAATRVLAGAPRFPVRILAVSCHYLTPDLYTQLSFVTPELRSRQLANAIDRIHDRWGENVVTSARLLVADQHVKDRISFGGVKDLEEYVFRGE